MKIYSLEQGREIYSLEHGRNIYSMEYGRKIYSLEVEYSFEHGINNNFIIWSTVER